jgi:hypothetical protein
MPFTLAPMGSQSVAIECPASLPVGMQRCTFTVRDTLMDPMIDLLGVCETQGAGLLSANPTSVNFFDVDIGSDSSPETVVISSGSGAPTIDLLQLQIDDDNFLIRSPCPLDASGCDAGSIPSGSSTPVEVICRPTSPGTHTGQLFAIGTNGVFLPMPVSLTCNGASMGSGGVAVIEGMIPIDLGPVEVKDSANATRAVSIRNAGSGAIDVTSVSIADDGVPMASLDWSITSFAGQCTTIPCPLATGQSVVANLRFDPSQLGSRPAEIIVNYTNPGAQQTTAALRGFGMGATVELATGETTLDFGVVALNMASQKTFALKNLGNRPTTANLSAMPMAPFSFPASVIVTPGADPIVTVTCQSSTTGLAMTNLVIGSPDALTSPFTLTLICDVRDTLIVSTPTSHSFGEIRRNSGMRSQMFDIDRVGAGSAVALDNPPTLQSANPNLTLGMLSQNQTSATFTLTVDPNTDGTLMNTVTVTPSGMTPITIPITGSVVTPSFAVANVLSLGTFCIGQETSSTLVTLMSNGTGRFMLAEPALQADPSPFTIAPQNPSSFPAQIDPAATATVLVTPKRGTAPEEVEDNIVWSADFGTPALTRVTAQFVDDGGAIAPSTLEFGDVQIRVATAPPQTITLQNCAAVPLELVEPTVPQPFVLVNQFPTMLAPAQKATFEVAFRPTEPGPVERTLEITSTANDTFSVVLRGNGITGTGPGDDDGNPDKASLYACTCRTNDPAGAGVILVALAVILRRRRR